MLLRTCALAALICLAAPGTAAAEDQGLVRLAHLSPDTPAVDVYLYAQGNETPRLILRHVGYGALSPYQRLAGGSYTVAMRTANAPATSKPVLSTSVRVRGGAAYTVAGMGPYKGVHLKVLNDTASLPEEKAGLRVIAASLKEPSVDVTANGRTLARSLKLATVTPYRHMNPISAKVRVAGHDDTADTEVDLIAGQMHTVIVLDGADGMRLQTLRDASPGTVPPGGGAETGFGGTASREPAPPVLPILAVVAVVAALRLIKRSWK